MSQFQKGHKKVGGKKKGTPNKKRVPLVTEFLGGKGINPAQEILNLIPQLPIEKQTTAWKDLLSYTQPRVIETNVPPAPAAVPESSAPSAQLLSLVKKKTGTENVAPIPETAGDNTPKVPESN